MLNAVKGMEWYKTFKCIKHNLIEFDLIVFHFVSLLLKTVKSMNFIEENDLKFRLLPALCANDHHVVHDQL